LRGGWPSIREKALPYAKGLFVRDLQFRPTVIARDGQADLAKRSATQAYELSATGGTDADRDLAAAVLKQWPEIADNR